MLGLVALLLSAAVWLEYLVRIPKASVPRRPFVHAGLQIAAVGLGIAAIATSQMAVLGLAGVLLAGFFLWLLTQASMPQDTITVAVGDRLMPFVARTDAGATFDSAQLEGSRVLPKFFRGHW